MLLVLLAVEGFTILRIGRLLTLHFFLGMLLIGPVALKAGSVIYRFATMVIHVLAYLPRLPRLLAAEARGVSLSAGETELAPVPAVRRHARRAARVLGGRGTRVALLTASLLAGLIIALLTVHLAGRWELGG